MRLVVTVLCAFLSGCVTAQQQAADDWKAIAEARDVLQKDCVRRFEAGEIKTHLGRAECLNAAEEQAIGDKDPYPDIRKVTMTARIALATKVDSGEMSDADARFEFAQITAQLTSEVQRRNAERQRRDDAERQRTAAAWQNAADAWDDAADAWAPPRTVNCTSTVVDPVIYTNCR